MKVDVASAAIKRKSANWIISAWQAHEGRPEAAVNGFKKAGIYSSYKGLVVASTYHNCKLLPTIITINACIIIP